MSSSAQETTRVCLACGLETQDDIANCPKDGSLLAAGTDPLVGTTFLEKYQITNVLGRGGMSAVYKAKHLMMDRFVAIKFLRSELVHDNVMLQRFQLESKAVSLLKHPNIIAVYDFGLSPAGIPYLIMDFLDGKTVADLVEESGHLEPHRCVMLFTQICHALAHTHTKGVIHRDIKPSNLIISIGDDGQELAQVVDFGIAKLLEREASDASKLTASGEVFGSPAYMSPEQCNGSAIDARTDIYALGCVIYNCLTGRPPLLGRNAMETVLMHVRDMPKPFAEIRPDLTISPVLERVVFKALAKDPAERFQTMSEFGSELTKSVLENNNNTTWVIPAQAQKAMQDNELAAKYEHTMPVGQAPNVTPHPNASSLAEFGKADPIVSLSDDQKQNSNPSSDSGSAEANARGGMNPNSMIVPGSDLFGYESLRPALPDANMPSPLPTPSSTTPAATPTHSAAQTQSPTPTTHQAAAAAPARASIPAPSRIVDDIPLQAPPKLRPGSTSQVSQSQANPTQNNQEVQPAFKSQTTPQPETDVERKKKLIMILSIVLGVSVVILVLMLIFSQQHS